MEASGARTNGTLRGRPGTSSSMPATTKLTGCSRSPSRKVSPTANGSQSVGSRREMTTGIGRSRVPAPGPVGGSANAAGNGWSTGEPAMTAAYAGTSSATKVVDAARPASSRMLVVGMTRPAATASTPGTVAGSGVPLNPDPPGASSR